MFQLNLPKKTVASVHVAIVCLLIVLSLIFSFLPIITIRTNDKNTASGIISIVHKFGGDVRLEDLEEIKVSAPKLLKSVLVISDVIKVVGDGGKASPEDKENLRNKMNGDSGKDTILICVAIVYTITNPIKEQSKNESSGLINIIFNVLIAIVAMLYLLGISIAMPIIFIISAIKALIPVAKNFRDLHLHTATVANKLPEKLSILLTIMLFQCVLPSVSYGSGTLALFIITLICVFINFVSTRLTSYDKEDFIYLNIVQGASLLSLIGFFIFFFNVLTADIFSTFTHGSWGWYVSRIIRSSSGANAPKGYIVDAILILIYLVAVLSCVKFLAKCANRFSCALTVKPKKAYLLPESIALLIVYIIPKIVAARESRYLNPVDKSSGVVGSFLELSSDQKSALNAILIGTIIMIASEIAFIVLDRIFCIEMSDEAKEAVLNNSYEPFVFEEIDLPFARKSWESEETTDTEENSNEEVSETERSNDPEECATEETAIAEETPEMEEAVRADDALVTEADAEKA